MTAPSVEKKTPAAAKTIEVFDLRAVHGLLIHPFDETRFDTEKVTPHARDAWVNVQIEAGKLEVVAAE